MMGQRLSERLGQPFIIENRPGAGTNIGTEAVVRAPPDGYTLLLVASVNAINATLYDKLSFNFIRDIAPVASIIRQPLIMLVNPSLPVKTVPEFIAYAKANPGKLSYGSAGSGTMSNLSGELFKQLTGLNDLVHIPYKGAGPGITDLVSGHIPMMSPNVTAQILELHRAGKIRILAVNATERLSAAPDIPTAIEEGVPGMIGLLFLGLFAPAATPKPIVDRIAAASRAAMADAEFQKVLIAQGLEAIPDSDSEKAKLFMDEEIARWAPVVKASGFKVE